MKLKLDKVIKIQKRELVTNENAVEEEIWIDYIKSFASVNNLFGREYWQAASVQGETTVEFLIRYTNKLKDVNCIDFRLVFDNEIYDIIPPVDNIKYANNLVKIKGKRHER